LTHNSKRDYLSPRKFNREGASNQRFAGEKGKKRTKKGKETKRSIVFSDIVLMKESQHQAPALPHRNSNPTEAMPHHKNLTQNKNGRPPY
jgi:hypothetical protein